MDTTEYYWGYITGGTIILRFIIHFIYKELFIIIKKSSNYTYNVACVQRNSPTAGKGTNLLTSSLVAGLKRPARPISTFKPTYSQEDTHID